MVLLIIFTTLVLLIGYLLIDAVEYAEESILAHLRVQLFNRGVQAEEIDSGS
jgi:hypothetical protein